MMKREEKETNKQTKKKKAKENIIDYVCRHTRPQYYMHARSHKRNMLAYSTFLIFKKNMFLLLLILEWYDWYLSSEKIYYVDQDWHHSGSV